jgi:hypothetical protein
LSAAALPPAVSVVVGAGALVLPALEALMETSPPWRKPVEPATTGPALVLVFVEKLSA